MHNITEQLVSSIVVDYFDKMYSASQIITGAAWLSNYMSNKVWDEGTFLTP